MPIRNVFVTEHFDSFIDSGIEAGRYSDADEVVREGLRLLEQREAEDRARIEWLRSAAQGGIEAIDGGAFARLTTKDELSNHLRGLRGKLLAF